MCRCGPAMLNKPFFFPKSVGSKVEQTYFDVLVIYQLFPVQGAGSISAFFLIIVTIFACLFFLNCLELVLYHVMFITSCAAALLWPGLPCKRDLYLNGWVIGAFYWRKTKEKVCEMNCSLNALTSPGPFILASARFVSTLQPGSFTLDQLLEILQVNIQTIYPRLQKSN